MDVGKNVLICEEVGPGRSRRSDRLPINRDGKRQSLEHVESTRLPPDSFQIGVPAAHASQCYLRFMGSSPTFIKEKSMPGSPLKTTLAALQAPVNAPSRAK